MPIHNRLINSKSLLFISIAAAMVTIIAVWKFDPNHHRNFIQNSLVDTTILSAIFFVFMTIGLYKGYKLKDDIGKIEIKSGNMPNFSPMLDIGEGCASFEAEGIIFAILGWIAAGLFLLLLLFLFSEFFIPAIMVFFAAIYWIFYRAFRLVLKNSSFTRGNLLSSILYALGYTLLYNFWIYGILLGLKYVG